MRGRAKQNDSSNRKRTRSRDVVAERARKITYRDKPRERTPRTGVEHDRETDGAADVAPKEARRDEEQEEGGPQPPERVVRPEQDVQGAVDRDEVRYRDRGARHHYEVDGSVWGFVFVLVHRDGDRARGAMPFLARCGKIFHLGNI